MPTLDSANDVGERIQQLLLERQEHLASIALIDETLDRVGTALGGSKPSTGSARATPSSAGLGMGPVVRRGRPPGSGNKTRGKRRSRYSMSGEDSILNFVRTHQNPTTQDVKKHWASENRGGTADNALSQLVKNRKLKRIPLEGMRGSRYMLP